MFGGGARESTRCEERFHEESDEFVERGSDRRTP